MNYLLTKCDCYAIGGVVVEQDENDRFVAKPFNVNEVNKQKAMEEEQEPK